MRCLHSAANWTAAISTSAAAGCILVFLASANPPPYMLAAAETAAAIGMLALLLSLLALQLSVWRRIRGHPPPRRSLARARAGTLDPDLHRRLEVLDRRLDIDESRLCTQYRIPCTCWSLCAGSEDRRRAAEGAAPAAPEGLRLNHALAEEADAPPVHRSGMDDCPFRFASPLTPPAAGEDGAQAARAAPTTRS